MKNRQMRTAVVSSTLIRQAKAGMLWPLQQQMSPTAPNTTIHWALGFFGNQLTSLSS